MDGFDADALIYAVRSDHALGRRVRALFAGSAEGDLVGVGSVLLLPEVLSRPMRENSIDETAGLSGLLARLDIRPVDRATAVMATGLGAKYRLRTADAVHLATAVLAGADRLITNNRRDFSTDIEEIRIVLLEDLPNPDDDQDEAQ